MDNFGLFDAVTIQEERDETLAYLMELRAFKKNNPDRFREIRNLPLRARAGRKDRHRDTTTLTYIRNHRRDTFYYSPMEGAVEELSFVEAARIFKATAGEKEVPLHDQHHARVNAAIQTFRETLHQEAALGQTVDYQIGPNESKTLRFPAVFINHPTLAAEEEKFLLRAAQTAIKRATFARLQRDLNVLEKAHKKRLSKLPSSSTKSSKFWGNIPCRRVRMPKSRTPAGGYPVRIFPPPLSCRSPFPVIDAFLSIRYPYPMSTRQLTLGNFAAHCLDEIKSVQDGDTVIEILSSGGKVIAVLSPPPPEEPAGTLGDWMGSGAGYTTYGPGYDPDAPAFAPEDWEAFQEEKK